MGMNGDMNNMQTQLNLFATSNCDFEEEQRIKDKQTSLNPEFH